MSQLDFSFGFAFEFAFGFSWLAFDFGRIDLAFGSMITYLPFHMRIETERKLFVCIRVDNKMRDQLEHCAARDKMYFDGSNPQYLQVIRSVEEAFIGKIVDAGAAAASMDDLKRNIFSILTKVAPGRHRDDAIKVFALDDGDPPPLPPKEGEGETNDGSYTY